ncbi:NAD(P)/FAD-dependent oxidoreductase [Jatrophihabitans sp. DSM 45814]
MNRNPQVLVVGAGIAGAACARFLAERGIGVCLLERASSPGGRMASPLTRGRRVDIGASYFTVSDDGFASVVRRWQSSGLVREWTASFDVDPPRESERAVAAPLEPGPVRWAATHGLQSLVKDLIQQTDNLEVRLSGYVDSVDWRESTFTCAGLMSRNVVLAMPDPQARQLLSQSSALQSERARLDIAFESTIAVSLGWAKRQWGFSDGVFVNESSDISFVADDGARRGDAAPVLVVHTTAALAQKCQHDPREAIKPVLATLRERFGIVDPPDWAATHRWSVAKPSRAHPEPFGWFPIVADGDGGRRADDGGPPDGRGNGAILGVAGDAWCPQGAPRVESAWLSGTALGEHLAAQWK